MNTNLAISQKVLASEHLVDYTKDIHHFATGEVMVRYRFYFDNGYGASVIKGDGGPCSGNYTLGGCEDLWELALLLNVYGDRWEPIFSRDIVNNDILGYLSDKEVEDILIKIMRGELDNPEEERTI